MTAASGKDHTSFPFLHQEMSVYVLQAYTARRRQRQILSWCDRSKQATVLLPQQFVPKATVSFT